MLLVLAGRLTQFIVAFVSVKFMTTLLMPVEVGKIALITTSIAFFALLLVNPVGMFINRRLHAWVANGLLRYYFHLYCGYLVIVASVAGCLMWYLLHGQFWNVPLSPNYCATIIAASLIFNTINQTLIPSMNMLGRVHPFIVLTLSTLIVGLILSLVLTNWLGADAEAWLAGPVASQLLFSFVAYRTFFYQTYDRSVKLSRVDYARLYNFAWPISLAVSLNWLQFQGYRLILADQFGLADLGFFAAGYGLASSLTSASESVTTTWFQPRFYREVNSSVHAISEKAWGTYASTMIPFTIWTSSGVFLTAPYLTSVMLGPAYHDATSYVMAGAMAEWGRTMFNIFSLDAHSSMNTKKLILPSFIGAILTYTGITITVDMGKLVALPVAVLIGSLAMCVALHPRVLRKPVAVSGLDWRKILRPTVYVIAICIVFKFCGLFFFPALGSFEVFGALLTAMGLWGPVAIMFLRLDRQQPGQDPTFL